MYVDKFPNLAQKGLEECVQRKFILKKMIMYKPWKVIYIENSIHDESTFFYWCTGMMNDDLLE